MIDLIDEQVFCISTYCLWDSITDKFKDYALLLKAFKEAATGDVIILDLDCDGGDCDVGFKLIKYMRKSKAKVHVHVSGSCYSMGSLIAIAGDSLTMDDDTFLMFHTFSYGLVRCKSGDVEKYVINTDRQFKSQIDKIVTPFLSLEELIQMHDGKDFYVWHNDKSLKARIKRHFTGTRIVKE